MEQDADLPFPDGGWRAWSVVLGSWCAMVPSFGLMNSMGVFEAWLSSHQLRDYSKTSIGWIFSLYVFFLYFGSVRVGKKPQSIPFHCRERSASQPVFQRATIRCTRPCAVTDPGMRGACRFLMVFSVAQGAYSVFYETTRLDLPQ